MKKLFMLFAFMGLVGVATVSAQTCSKSKAECTAMAAKAASLDANINQVINEQTGKVSFVRKKTCEVSGKVSYSDVEYNADTKKFINVSPTHTSGKAAGKACCTGEKKGACCAGKAKATSASVSKKGGKACCKSKAACTKKSASAVKKTTSATAVKVSNE